MLQSLVFITGSTGFIGSHVVLQTLNAGYKVLLSVRKEPQIEGLKKLFSDHVSDIDFVVIPDLSISNAFDSALKDVEYVFHIASPMPGKGNDFKKEYLNPAVQGTTAVLDAAEKVSTIKRVVIVSSVLALVQLDAMVTGNMDVKEGLNHTIAVDPGMEFPEDPVASGGLKYHASKILAHRATLEWVAANKPHFVVVTLHPSMVFGRNLSQTSPDGVDGTNAMLWGTLYSETPLFPAVAVDVRDVARAHVSVLDTDFEGKNNEVQEFIISAGEKDGWSWTNVAKFVKNEYPSLGTKLEGSFDPPPSIKTPRAEEILGLKWKTMEDTIASFLDHQVELGAQL
ncbi:hypothetical protein HBI56_145920 [Parastagonospora nodorum]|uniref:NAD-dependent epimerase/dehydratase domain-containing protein n=1 Tax=Phaeosphaeria nodorum (strain SN15 / ATCC MYA-4574 / FGSC 10173) TaxID=321614 RepID=A0A7U2IC16_PHANO|nr:hypothetical protein HBH56_078960 [Parastagonospora nodorum]QRD07061.1 hypothetical protein JI435_125470 [Parastagonospora nodorum SN15]KAH3923399.1 hypothetical protein HBH54_209000 [Parastagonospora nodorum]KAH3952005.1 hypothetical protein HBH53_049190 [Parastagonospora nodorum]KAH3982935.1 hypothetical protein HBH52_073830 [Parastagonospora nodorum]